MVSLNFLHYLKGTKNVRISIKSLPKNGQIHLKGFSYFSKILFLNNQMSFKYNEFKTQEEIDSFFW